MAVSDRLAAMLTSKNLFKRENLLHRRFREFGSDAHLEVLHLRRSTKAVFSTELGNSSRSTSVSLQLPSLQLECVIPQYPQDR